MDGDDEGLRSQGLRSGALRARADGRHDAAIGAWRALLRLRPDDWTLALELKRDLRAALHYPDSDPQFRRAARRLPDAEWLAHYAALHAFHNDDLDALDRRARRLAEGSADARLHAILGDVARQRRDWAGAAAGFAAALALDPARAEYGAKLDAARMYQRVARTLASASDGAGPDGEGAYSIATINLDRNVERREDIARQFAACPAPLHRVPAIEGARLATAAVQRLGGDPAARGTLGCFLSHAAAWEAMLARGDAHCLVVEDDVVPLLDLPRTLAPFGLPAGFDVCFVNDRLEPKLDPRDAAGFSAHRLADVMRGFHPEDNAPGGDGYLISREGAEKLLRWVAQDGFAGDVDWRLLACALSPADIAALPRHGHAWAVLDRLRHGVGRPDRLDAHVLHPALIRTVGVSSDREDENRVAG